MKEKVNNRYVIRFTDLQIEMIETLKNKHYVNIQKYIRGCIEKYYKEKEG